MEILRTISFYTESRQMPFLVIGGHAVNAYGIARNTADIDLLVELKAKSDWRELMDRLNYAVGQDDERFSRFRSENLAGWPIDLMYVESATFAKMYSESIEHEFGEAKARVVSARQLVMLKIHALKTFQEHRYSKDFSDLVSLLRTGKTELSDDDFCELCNRYASHDLYLKLKGSLEWR